MTSSAAYDDRDFRVSERAVARRRLVAAVITVLALAGIAGGSVAGALAGAHDERADAGISQVHPQG